jgi:hypothetical protein
LQGLPRVRLSFSLQGKCRKRGTVVTALAVQLNLKANNAGKIHKLVVACEQCNKELQVVNAQALPLGGRVDAQSFVVRR